MEGAHGLWIMYNLGMNNKRQFQVRVELSYQADDESDAVAKATELTHILVLSGYHSTSTVVIDEVGETLAEFALDPDDD